MRRRCASSSKSTRFVVTTAAPCPRAVSQLRQHDGRMADDERYPAKPIKPPLADMSDEEFREFQETIQQARATQPMRTPR